MSDILKIVEDLVRIPSVSTNIKELDNVMTYIKNYFSKYKNVVIKEERHNDKPSLLLSNADTLSLDILHIGHVDVVPVDDNSMFNPVVKDGKMYGRGVEDMKSGVAMGMKSLEYVMNNNIPVKLGVLVVSDEEVGGKDCAMYWAQEKKLTSKNIVDLDGGTDITMMTTRRKAPFMADLVSTGEAVHGSQPWNGVDANWNLIKTLSNLEKLFPYYSKDTTGKPDDIWVTTMHVGTIHGGSAMNIISNYATAEIDLRRTQEYADNDKMIETIKKCIVGNITISPKVAENVVITDEKNEVVQKYVKSVEKITGKNVTFVTSCGGTDVRHFPLEGVNVVMHGVTGGGAHSKDEWVDIESIQQLEKIQYDFLDTFK